MSGWKFVSSQNHPFMNTHIYWRVLPFARD